MSKRDVRCVARVLNAARSGFQIVFADPTNYAIGQSVAQFIVADLPRVGYHNQKHRIRWYTGRVVKLRFFELGGDGRIGERWGAFVFQG